MAFLSERLKLSPSGFLIGVPLGPPSVGAEEVREGACFKMPRTNFTVHRDQ